MKKTLGTLVLMLFTVTMLVGCIPDEGEEPSKSDGREMIGYVMNKKDERILVIDPNAQDFSETGGVSEFYNAVWFANVPQGTDLGEKVKVWYDMTLDSYPAQSEIIRMEVIPGKKPDGANLSEAEALAEALTAKINTEEGLYVVKNIEYNAENEQWDITFKEIGGDDILAVQIDDQ